MFSYATHVYAPHQQLMFPLSHLQLLFSHPQLLFSCCTRNLCMQLMYLVFLGDEASPRAMPFEGMDGLEDLIISIFDKPN
jgi:hypothetical protein